MKKTTCTIRFILLSLMTISVASCKKAVFTEKTLSNVEVSAGGPNVIIIDTADAYIEKVDKISIPLTIMLSGPAPKAFLLDVSTNTDTINTLKNIDPLLANSITLSQGDYGLPPVVDIPFGITQLSFYLDIKLSTIEKAYGNNLAIAVRLDNPSRGNSLNTTKNTFVVLIKTTRVMHRDEVPYVGFTHAGSFIHVPDGDNFTQKTAGTISIPLSVFLGGMATKSFAVDVAPDIDTLNTLIHNQTLQNAIILAPQDYSFKAPIEFDTYRNKANLNVQVALSSFSGMINKKAVIALTLFNPTMHLLDPAKKTVIIVIDTDAFQP